MHLLSTGRDDRIHRWISDQAQLTTPRASLDSLRPQKEGSELLNLEWEIEELERQMSLTAAAFCRNWRTSIISNGSLSQNSDRLSPKCSPLPTVRERVHGEVGPGERLQNESFEGEAESWGPLYAGREEAIISQPQDSPPNHSPDHKLRSRNPPQPIATHLSVSSTGPRQPITFILQESESPLPSSIHFTPKLPDFNTFPTTPRSFYSFDRASERDLSHGMELVSSSEGPSSSFPPQTNPPSSSDQDPIPQPDESSSLVSSPTTPHTATAFSDASTITHSAFPSTPGTPWAPHPINFPLHPPLALPTLPPSFPTQMFTYEKPLPPPPPEHDAMSLSELSVDVQPSSRFSLSSDSTRSHSRSRKGSSSRASSRMRGGPSASSPNIFRPPVPVFRGAVTRQLTRSRSQMTPPRLKIQAHATSASMSMARLPQATPERDASKGWGREQIVRPKTPVTPLTPRTPSSVVSSFFNGIIGGSVSRKQPLVVSGVKRDDQLEDIVKRWFESMSAVKEIRRDPESEDLIVHFRDKDAHRKIVGSDPRQVFIPGVGPISLSLSRR